MFNSKKKENINTIVVLSMSLTLLLLFGYLYVKTNTIDSLLQTTAPKGQTLYVLSKLSALTVYVLMWWQIMLGLFKSLNTKHHIILGFSVLFLVIAHITLFVSAVSMRQDELVIGMLLPDFTSGYYQIGISLGVIALLSIVIAAISGGLRHKLPKRWKLGHGLVYVTFTLATVHGLMIGSDVNSVLFSYIVYGAIASLFVVFINKKLMFL